VVQEYHERLFRQNILLQVVAGTLDMSLSWVECIVLNSHGADSLIECGKLPSIHHLWKSCRLAPTIYLLNIRVKLNQVIHIILSARELMKLGDTLSSGELPGQTSSRFCHADEYLWPFISRLTRIRANHLPEIYLRVLGRVLTFMLETKSRSAEVWKWGGLSSAEDSNEMNVSSLMWDDSRKSNVSRLLMRW